MSKSVLLNLLLDAKGYINDLERTIAALENALDVDDADDTIIYEASTISIRRPVSDRIVEIPPPRLIDASGVRLSLVAIEPDIPLDVDGLKIEARWVQVESIADGGYFQVYTADTRTDRNQLCIGSVMTGSRWSSRTLMHETFLNPVDELGGTEHSVSGKLDGRGCIVECIGLDTSAGLRLVVGQDLSKHRKAVDRRIAGDKRVVVEPQGRILGLRLEAIA